jgi:hypothetical protein
MSDVDSSLEFGSSPEEISAVADVLSDFGLDGTVTANRMHFSEAALRWTLVLEVYLLGKFLDGFLGAAGENAWESVRDFVLALTEARRRVSGRPGSHIEIRASDGARVHIALDLPDQAFRVFAEVNLQPGCWYVWEPEFGEWRAIDPLG